jgi:hypothetical protein
LIAGPHNCAFDDATVVERDGLAALEATVERTRRDAECGGSLRVEMSGAIFLRDAVAEGGQAVPQRLAGDSVLAVLENFSGFDRVDAQLVAEERARVARRGADEIFEPRGSVKLNRLSRAREPR